MKMTIQLEVEVSSEEISDAYARPARIHSGLFNALADLTFEADDHTYAVRPKVMSTEAAGGQWVTSR